MSNSISHYINTEEFKEFINGSFVYQDDSLVKLAVEDIVKSGLSPETLSKDKHNVAWHYYWIAKRTMRNYLNFLFKGEKVLETAMELVNA